MSVFALLDCNNFFVSCERVFNPKLESKPVAILSNNDGCIIARSNEVKKLGIPMGAPFYKYKEICNRNNVTVLSSNYQLYGDMSYRIMKSLKMLTPEVEMYSIDEAFLRLDDFACLGVADYARFIRTKIKMWTGIPVSIGIGANKTLAKAANYVAKRIEGVFDLRGWEEKILNDLEVRSIWGIGSKLSEKLNRLGIFTAKQLREADIKLIQKRFGIVGERIVRELQGQVCFELDKEPQPRKNIMSSRSFGRVVTELKDLEEAISNYTALACEKLRRQEGKVQAIYVYIRTNLFKDPRQFYQNSKVYKFTIPTNDTRLVINRAKECVKAIYKPGYKYYKAGIVLTDIVDRNYQGNIFENVLESQTFSSTTLMKSIDSINVKMGGNTLFFGAQGTERSWKMKSDNRSPRYTTNWNELPKAA